MVETGDIVYVLRPANDPISDDFPADVFRIMAVGGSTVAVVDEALVVDGATIPGTSGIGAPSDGPTGCLFEDEGCPIGPDEVFVVGDNFQGSRDSRLFGPLPIENVLGIVIQ